MATQTKMTPDDRKFQELVLTKYRESGIVPIMNTIKQETGISHTTIAYFMHGNASTAKLRDYLRVRFTKNLKPLPEDVIKLLAIWDNDK